MALIPFIAQRRRTAKPVSDLRPVKPTFRPQVVGPLYLQKDLGLEGDDLRLFVVILKIVLCLVSQVTTDMELS